MVELTVRLVFSLAVVVGMLLLLARFSARRFRGGADALVRVVHRQSLSRTSAVAVVSVGSRVLVLGTTEHNVRLLTELDPDELDLDDAFDPAFDDALRAASGTVAPAPTTTVLREDAAAARRTAAGRGRHAAGRRRPRATTRTSRTSPTAPSPAPTGPLAGSVLSTQTWRQAFAVATRKVQDAS